MESIMIGENDLFHNVEADAIERSVDGVCRHEVVQT